MTISPIRSKSASDEDRNKSAEVEMSLKSLEENVNKCREELESISLLLEEKIG